jgi:hypothetical protein
MDFSRRGLFLLPLVLAGCGDEPSEPASYPPLMFDYLGVLRIDVGRIEIDDNWVPRGAARHVEFQAPVTPRDALVQMAKDRLVAGGTKGSASFVIEDAAIIRGPASYEASFAVRLDIADEGGMRLGEALARITKVRPAGDASPEAVRATLYDFVRDVMRDMNVEFEFKVRQALKAMLQPTDAVAPSAPKVETEELDQQEPQGAPQPGVLGTLPVKP